MKNIITNIDSRSPLAESIKTLRTNLQFMRKNKGLQTILVTSTLPSEGKSWVSSNLAVAFAQAGKKTLLIDSDMRKGTAHYIFDLPLTPGLSNYLSGVNMSDNNYHITSVMQETEIENLRVITAGDIPPNPSELIMSDKMKDLFEELEQVADVVIFDGTPSVLVTDAIILSRMVTSTVIIAEYNKTKMTNLKQVKEDIEKVGGKIAGVVLNKIPVKGRGYGYGKYGYGKYGYGYGTYGYSSYGSSVLPSVVKENPIKTIFKKIKSFFQKTALKIKQLAKIIKEKHKENAKIREEKRIERKKEAERIRLEKEKEAERIRIEKEKEAERIRIEKEKEAERIRIEKEQAEKIRQEKEKAEKLRIEQEKAEKKRLEKEKAEKLKLEKEKAEKLRIEKEKEEKLRLEREKAEKIRIEQEKEAERIRIEKEKEEEKLHTEEKIIKGDNYDRYTHTYFTRHR